MIFRPFSPTGALEIKCNSSFVLFSIPTEQMHFLVLGASGAIGSQFCDFALEGGHTLTLFVRDASKLPASLRDHDSAAIIEGTLEDESSLEDVSQCDADAFVSFAGPPVGNKGTPLTNGYKALIPKLLSQNIKRILILCTPSFHSPEDQISFKWRLSIGIMKTFSHGQYAEMVGIGEYVSSLSVDKGVRWTLFRVGLLTNGEEGNVEATHLGSGKDVMWISRASVAGWVLDEADRGRFLGKMPYICNL